MLFGLEKNFCLAGIMDRACSEASGAVPFKWNHRKLNSTLIYWLHARTDYKRSITLLSDRVLVWLTDVATLQIVLMRFNINAF